MFFFATEAFAMAAPQAGGEPAGGMAMLMQFFPLILMFVIFWFLLIRPQQKRAKEHKKMISELKRGDDVVTGAGIVGRIYSITDETVVIESEGSKILMLRGAVSGLANANKQVADAAKKGKKSEKPEKEEKKAAAPADSEEKK